MTMTLPPTRDLSSQAQSARTPRVRTVRLGPIGVDTAHVTAPARAGSVRPAAGRPLRLTRRGRVVVVLGTLVALLLVGFTLGRVSGSRAAGVPVVRTVVVQPGDTLWSVASRVDPGRDPRRVVAGLIAVNHLHGGEIEAGERLTVSG